MNIENISNHSSSSLEFINNQADILAQELLTSIRRTINKSYIAAGIYLSFLVYLFKGITDGSLWHIFVIPSLLICLYYILKNVKPHIISLRGETPELILDYTKDTEEKYCLLVSLHYQIQKNQESIDKNDKVIKSLSKNYKRSLGYMIGTVIYYTILFIINTWLI